MRDARSILSRALLLGLLLLAQTSCPRTTEYIGFVGAPEWNCGAGCFRDENLGGVDTDALFAAPTDSTPALRPALVYPFAGSVHPPNLGEITLQWRRGGGIGQPYFRVRVAAVADPRRRYDLFIPCHGLPRVDPPPPDQCQYDVPRRVWRTMALENPGAEVEISIAASDTTRQTVATSDPVRIAFAPGAIEGGIYYWSTERQGMFRALPGTGPGRMFLPSDSPANRFACGGCHAVSRDGRVVAFSAQKVGYPADGYLTVTRAENPAQTLIAPPEPPVPSGATMSLHPDGSLVAVSYGSGTDSGHLAVLETATGKKVAELDPNLLTFPDRKVYFPDWSRDGAAIVATVASSDDRPWRINDGGIAVFPYQGGAFGAPTVVVPNQGPLFHYYPAFSPDGAWIAFTSAPRPGKSYGNPQSRLQLVSRNGGLVYQLTSATHETGRTSSYPRFVPSLQAEGRLMFITFNSKIDYGLVIKNSADPTGGVAQIWMAAIDLRKLASGDPSSPPVWLPFQQLQQVQQNLLGTWADRLVCRAGDDCGEGATCADGRCAVTGN